MTAQNSSYNFDADVNRDGVINSQDLMIAKQDLGASTKVSPVVSVNLDPASNPAANRTVPLQHGSLRRNGHAKLDRDFHRPEWRIHDDRPRPIRPVRTASLFRS